MKKIRFYFDHIGEVISSVLLFIVFLLLGYSIIGRILGLPTTQVQEIIQYGFVVSILFGISFAAKEREHIRADIILEHVSEKIKRIMLLFADLIWLFFSACLVWYGVPFIQNMIEFPQYTALLRIPFWILYAMVPLSGLLTCFRIIQTNISSFRNQS